MQRGPLLALSIAFASIASLAHAQVPAKDSPMGRLVGVILGSQACGVQPTQAQEAAVSEAGAALSRKLKLSAADQRGLVAQFGNGTPEMGCDAFKAFFNGLVDQAVAGAR